MKEEVKEKLNDVVCQSSSDYEIIYEVYKYIEELEHKYKEFKKDNHTLELIDDVFNPLKVVRFSSLENCFVFLYAEANRRKCKELVNYFDDLMWSIRGFDTKDINKILSECPRLSYYYNKWSENKINKEELIDYLKEKIKHLDNLINKSKPKPYGTELALYENSKLRYLEIIDKIEKE